MMTDKGHMRDKGDIDDNKAMRPEVAQEQSAPELVSPRRRCQGIGALDA